MTVLQEQGAAAKLAAAKMALAGTETKNKALLAIADALLAHQDEWLEANAADWEAAKAEGMNDSMLDRLKLTKERIEGIAEGVRQAAALPDPIGTVTKEIERPNGLKIQQRRVPLGVIGMIFEARPNVAVDAAVLCLKAGNACILRGGRESIRSNTCAENIMRAALESAGLPADAVSLVKDTSRESAKEMMHLEGYIDVLIPRGGAGLIRAVVENSKIPVIETGTGNCHIYVDKDADLDMAMKILVNAKTQRIGVCNAAESLVVHRAVLDQFLPMLAKTMEEYNVTLRADEDSRAMLPLAEAATEEDFGREYLALMLSVKTVDSVEEAIEHINRYHTGHSDCIVTNNSEAADRFLQEIDSACVYVNVSTRFTDGFEFGFGAEIGISTQKLQARGPMGLREITSYKYQITGDGQVRG